MKYFVLLFALLVSVFIISTPVYGVINPDENHVLVEHQVYQPGEKVKATINFANEPAQGDLLFFRVLGDTPDGKAIFSVVQPITDQNTEIEFTIPNEAEYDRLILLADSHTTDGKSEFIRDTIIYTSQNALDREITNFNIDKQNIRPGETINVTFQVTDGNGKHVPWAEAQLSLCKEIPRLPNDSPFTPYISERLEREHPGLYDYCIINYPELKTASGTFDFKLRIHDSVPPGDYYFVVFATSSEVYNTEEFVERKSVGIKVAGDPVPAQSPDMFLYPDIERIDSKDVPRIQHPTYGDTLTIAPRQTTEGEYYLDEGAPFATSDFTIHTSIVSPHDDVVFDKTGSVKPDGTFEKISFPITEDLPLGAYTIYFNTTKDGIFVYPYGGGNTDVFYVQNTQKFLVEADNDEFDVFFQSLNLIASELEFDKESKTLSFNVKRLEGKFYDKGLMHRSLQKDEATITIERPLMGGPYHAILDGQTIDTYWVPTKRNYDLNIEEIYIENLDQSGTITITSAHVIPEFGSVVVFILIVSILSVVAYGRFSRFSEGVTKQI